jgi:ribosome-dependent ATPase
MMAFGYGISFDVENLKYAAFDQDQTPESRTLLESFSGSRYFAEQPPVSTTAEMDDRFRKGELSLVVEIPSGFGRDLLGLHPPSVAVWIDGAMPFRGPGLGIRVRQCGRGLSCCGRTREWTSPGFRWQRVMYQPI